MVRHADRLQALLKRDASVLWRTPDGRVVDVPDDPPVGVLSGSFNPLHDGHIRLLDAAADWIGGLVAFELTVVNADKPPLNVETVLARCEQFTSHPLALTAAPKFEQKAQILPETVFVVGFDTAARIVQPRFYGGDRETMSAALHTIETQGCRFLVAGRLQEGRFLSLHDAAIPPQFAHLFEELPESAFRSDASSTEIRRRGRNSPLT